jgi:GT2 family glycosyltransferase/SAM-dependent methyltransferase
MTPLFSIIIPTWNNPQFLTPCLNSIIRIGTLNGFGEIIVVNNGKQPIKAEFGNIPGLTVLEPGENLGWEKGLELGLKHSKAEFVCFQNDDTQIPTASWDFYSRLLHPFSDPDVAAVGPATTTAAGWHSMFMRDSLLSKKEVPYLIFFTVMIRRAHLDLVGGIDTTAPGGDDIDLSIRFRKAGKKLIVNPFAFLIHHGFKSGERLRGDSRVSGGWNSLEMRDTTNNWLIQKHGFKTFFGTTHGVVESSTQIPGEDIEGRIVAEMVEGEKVLELGCGYRKTVERAVGIDLAPAGTPIPNVPGGVSVADIVADASKELPVEPLSQDTVIARHILEHCLNTVETLKNWRKVLKVGGRLVVAVPNQDICNSIPLNPEHVHAFTQTSLKAIAELCGFKEISHADPGNGISFVACFEKLKDVVKDPDLVMSENGHTKI